jgi:hypothetical protein
MHKPYFIIFGGRTKSFKIYLTFKFFSTEVSHQAPVMAVLVDFFLVTFFFKL